MFGLFVKCLGYRSTEKRLGEREAASHRSSCQPGVERGKRDRLCDLTLERQRGRQVDSVYSIETCPPVLKVSNRPDVLSVRMASLSLRRSKGRSNLGAGDV